MRRCNCGPKKVVHQVVHPDGKTVTYRDEPTARAVADEVGGTYQAVEL